MPGRDRQNNRATSDRMHVVAVMDYLLRDTSIEEITVSAICAAAQISRTSFYRLFDDKYDAANWFMCRALDLGNRLTGINYTWYEGNLITLSGCILMRNLMAGAWKSPGYHAMKETGIRRRRQDLLDVLAMRHIEMTDELMFQVDSFAYLESYLARTWICSDSPRPVEEMASYIEPCVPRGLHDLLKDPIDPQPAKKLELSSFFVL